MKTILLNNDPVVIEFGRYDNGTVAIQANLADDSEPYCTLTVNWESNWQGHTPYGEFFPFPAVVIKNYSENEGMCAALEAAGVIERGGAYLAGSNGGVEVRRLTPEWQQEFNRQQLTAAKI
jgi:hypothetical protein